MTAPEALPLQGGLIEVGQYVSRLQEALLIVSEDVGAMVMVGQGVNLLEVKPVDWPWFNS